MDSQLASTSDATLVSRSQICLSLAIGALLAAKFFLTQHINIHWDEFYFLSLIHDYLRGAVTSRMQTFHVHLFSWLPRVGATEIDQIIIGRLCMAVLSVGTAALIYHLGRRFLTRTSALVGLLGYLSLTAVLEHGASFRADPLITFISVAAIYLILRHRDVAAALIAAGTLLALATMLTLKSVFYLPIVAIVILHSDNSIAIRLRGAILFGTAFLATFGVLYLSHAASLPSQPGAETARYLHSTASKVMFDDGLLPRWEELIHLLARNPLYFLMLGSGIVIAWRNRRLMLPPQRSWLPLGLNVILLVPLFYRNAFAYYYVCLLPFSAVLVGLSFEANMSRLGAGGKDTARRLVTVFIGLQIVILTMGLLPLLRDEVTPQREVLAAVHQIFPAPVPYIDGYGAVASHPRFSFFMSSWGLDQYHRAGVAVFPDLVKQGQPPLLLADSVALYEALMPNVVIEEALELLPEDRLFLADNYVQHWGLAFVAGKKIVAAVPGEAVPFDIAIAGDYRVDGADDIRIDEMPVRPGESVHLTTGPHHLAAGRSGEVILRWAAALPGPAREPPGLAAFFGGE